MSTRILLADDHELFRQGLRSLLEKHADLEVVGEAHDGRAAVELTAELHPDLVIMDITMPGLNGVEATRRIIAGGSGARVLALSMHSSRRFMAEVLKAGASGYMLKECAVAELMLAVTTVTSGQSYLSPRVTDTFVGDYLRHVPADRSEAFTTLTTREREVLQLVAEGKSTKEIGGLLHVSPKTVEAHRSHIMDKLKIDTIAGLTKFAISEGLTSPEP